MNNLPTCINEFVDEAKSQQMVRDAIAMAQSLGATQSEVGMASSIGFHVSVRMGEIDTLEFNRDKAIGITVYVNNRKGSASTTDIHPDSLRQTVEAAIHLAKLTEADPFSGLAESNEMANDLNDLKLYHPWNISVENAIELAKICEKSAFSMDNRIKNSEGASLNTSQSYRVYGNSHGFIGAYPSTRHSLSCTVIAQEDSTGMERDYDYTLSRNAHGLTAPETVGRLAAENAVKRLHARKVPTQKVPVIYHSKVASGFLGHFLAGISGGRLFRQSSFLQDSLGKKHFPDHIHIYERPHLLGELASANFDNDGVATTEKDFVRDGIVQNYVLSAYSSRKLKMPNTGNAGGVHNIRVSHTEDTLASLIKKMDRGLLITELMGPGVNLVTGDYSRGASGFWVENGEIQYPVHEVTVAGQLKNMFLNCVAIGNDIDIRHSVQTGSILIAEMTVAGD